MIVFHYEIIEKIFGTYVADHFDEIWTVLMIVGIFAVILSKKSNKTPKNRHAEKHYNEPKWYPSGWHFNEKTQLWESPDYINEDAAETENQKLRMERYRRFRRSQGKEPTYEEWKAAREAEQRSDAESSN